MGSTTQQLDCARRTTKRLVCGSKIEHLLDWAEPIVRNVCREVWREARPRGLELEDLHQEGRIAVFQAAEEIACASDHAAMVATVVRRQAIDAMRLLADWDGPSPDAEEDEPPQVDAPMAAG